MATRFYIPATTPAPALSPSFDSGWNYATEGTRRILARAKFTSPSAITVGTRVGPWSNTAGQKALDLQLLSPPLAAQTISGTFSAMSMTREYAATDNVDRIVMCVKVVNSSGTVVGTLYSLGTPTGSFTTEYSATAQTQCTLANGQSLTSYTCSSGDRLLIEVGFSNSTAATTPEASFSWGENATDATLGTNTGTTNVAPWIEFSGNLTFLAPVVSSVSGSNKAGGTATITGSGFVGGATVTINGNSATSVVVVSDTTITCVVPSGSGTGDIVVTNPDSLSGTLTNGFTYAVPTPMETVFSTYGGAELYFFGDSYDATTGTWTDSQGLATPVTQSSSGLRPTKDTTISPAGRAFLSFDGVDDYLSGDGGVIATGSFPAWSGYFIEHFIFQLPATPSFTDFTILISFAQDNNYNYLFDATSGPIPGQLYGHDVANTSKANAGPVGGTLYHVSVEHDVAAGVTTLVVNGVAQTATGTNTSAIRSDLIGIKSFGREYWNARRWLKGYLGAIGVGNATSWGSTQRAALYQAVQDYWNGTGGGGSGALTGSATASVTASGTLTGNGALVGSAPIAVSASGTLTATGALTGSVSISISASAAPTAIASASGSASIALNAVGTLLGTGSLVGSAPLSVSPSGTLKGTGSLSGSTTLGVSPAGSLTGVGALSGAASIAVSPSATLTGSGALSGSAPVSVSPTGTLSGLGALTGSAPVSIAPIATLTGLGSLGGSAPISLTLSGTIGSAGSGLITGTAQISLSAVGTLSGAGALAGNAPISVSSAGTLTGLAPLTGSAPIAVSSVGTLTGKGALSGSAPIAVTAVGTLSSAGSGLITGSVLLSLSASGTLTGKGALVGAAPIAVTPSGTLTGLAPLSGSTTIAVTPAGTLRGIAPLVGSAPISIAVSGSLDGLEFLVGTAPIGITLTGTLTGRGALSGNAPVSLSAIGTLSGIGAVIRSLADIQWSFGPATLVELVQSEAVVIAQVQSPAVVIGLAQNVATQITLEQSMTLYIGDTNRLKFTFRDPDTNALVDPSVMWVEVTPPGQTVADVYTYGDDDNITRLSTGVYQCEVDLTVDGHWKGSAHSPGPVGKGVKPFDFYVDRLNR